MEHIEPIRSLDSKLSSESARFRGNSTRTRDIRQNATPNKFYHGEDVQITKAVQKCAKLVYEAFKKFKHRGKTNQIGLVKIFTQY